MNSWLYYRMALKKKIFKNHYFDFGNSYYFFDYTKHVNNLGPIHEYSEYIYFVLFEVTLDDV